MIRVLHLVQHMQLGGLEKMALNLLNSSEFESHIVAIEGDYSQAVEHLPEISMIRDKVHFLNKANGVDIGAIKDLRKLINRLDIKIVHSHHVGPLLYGSAALIGSDCRHLHTVHDAWYLQNAKLRWLSICCFKLFSPHLVADAHHVAYHTTRLSGQSVDKVIHNGIDTERFSPGCQLTARVKMGLSHIPRWLGCAARVEDGKGHRKLIDSLVGLPSNVGLAFAGIGSKQYELMNYCEQLGLTERVKWLGNCDNMPDFYRAIDGFCLISEQEGLPLTILEAMGCGVPVVASDVGGIGELLDANAGKLLNEQQVAELPRVLNQFLQDLMPTHETAVNKAAISLSQMTHCYDQCYQQLGACHV